MDAVAPVTFFSVFGVLVLASGVFMVACAALALIDARSSVHVQRGLIGDMAEGHGLVCGRVVAAHGSVPAPYTELPCVFAHTRVVTTTSERPTAEAPASVRGVVHESIAFTVEDVSGSVNVREQSSISGLHASTSEPLDRLPDHLEAIIVRRYGELAALRPVGGQFRVIEAAVLEADALWLTTFTVRWQGDLRNVILAVGVKPVIPELRADYSVARAFAACAALLVASGVIFLASGFV